MIVILLLVTTSMVFTKVDAAQQCKKKKNHKEPFPVPLEKQQEIFKSTNKTPNNIEYVGCGYDMYNRSGIDDQTGFSLKNYRAPVLDYYTLETNTDDQNYGKLGLWWSNEYVCDLSQELTTVKTKQDLKSLITSHTNEGYSNVFDSYSKDVNTTDDIYNKLKRSRNVLVRKYRCTVYSAGLIYNTRRMNTKRFDEIVNKLVDLCEGGFRDDNCPVEKYERNMDDEGCDGCITSWMRFFADFGTHLTIRLSMGGIFRRFTNVSQKKAMRDASKKETTTTFSSTWFGLSTSTTSNARKSDSKISRENKEDDIAQYTVGPEPHNQSMTPEVFEQWVRNVGLNPVPIDVEFSPLSEIMASNEAKKLYNEALKYYAKLKGVDHTEFLRTEIFKSPIVHLLKQSKIVAINGRPQVAQDVCSGKAKIILGFGVNLNKDMQILELKNCYAGLNACILDLNKDVNSTFILAMCGDPESYDIIQKVTKGAALADDYSEVRCPKGSVVGFGAIIQFYNPLSIASCPIGATSCGYPNLGPKGLIWVACFPKETFGFNLYETKTKVISSGERLECERGFKVANGFTIWNDLENTTIKVSSCNKFDTGCYASKESHTKTGAYIYCVH